jgi:Fe-S oxidoreductase
MLPHDEDAGRLSRDTLTLGEFLTREAQHFVLPRLNRKAVVHGHCHQKAIMGMSAEQELYSKLGLDFEMPDSGCCGLAGSWGFEHDKYDLSMKIGERRLLPAVRNADKDTILIADGFSCKTQVEHATERRALHTAQVIKMALDHGENGPEGDYPERCYPDVILDDGKGLKLGAAAIGGTAAAALLWRLRRRRGASH